MRLSEADMLQAGKYLLSCLTGAIDRAMTHRFGDEWFIFVKEKESVEKKPFLENEESVRDMDLQACLKLFKFRSDYRDTVLSYFGFYENATPEECKKRRNTFTAAVTRLMTDYRNAYMHLRAQEAAGEWRTGEADGAYGVAEALEDMKTVAQYFIIIRDKGGVSYYDRICECAGRYEKERNVESFSVSGQMSLKGFRRFSESDFIRACSELNIPVEEENGEFFFLSDNSERDLGRIKRQLDSDYEDMGKRSRKGIALTAATVGSAAVVTALLINAFNGGAATKSKPVGVSVESFTPAAVEADGDISLEEADAFIQELVEMSQGSYEDYKTKFAASYREDKEKERYIKTDKESTFMQNAPGCIEHMVIPVVQRDGVLAVSAIYYNKQADPQYKTSRRYPLVRENGSIKADLEKITLFSDSVEILPTGYISARAEGRNTWVNDAEDFTFANEEAVYKGQVMQEGMLAWEEKDGSVSVLVRLSNGESKDREYSSLHLGIWEEDRGLMYEGDVDMRQGGRPYISEAGRGENFIINIKKGSLSESGISGRWSGLKIEVT